MKLSLLFLIQFGAGFAVSCSLPMKSCNPGIMSQICDGFNILAFNTKQDIVIDSFTFSSPPFQIGGPLKELTQEDFAIAYIASHNDPSHRALVFKVFCLANVETVPTEETAPSWKKTAESKWEIQQFHQILLSNPEFTNNYEFEASGKEDNYLGRGREGIVFKALSKETGHLLAIKVKCERDPEIHPYDGEEEVTAAGWFEEASGYPFEAHNHPGTGRYPGFNAKRLIEGPNLEDLMTSGEIFNGSDESEKIMTKLGEVLTRLVSHNLFFADLAPENFVYDGENFYIIDLRPVERFVSEAKHDSQFTANKYMETMFEGEIAWNNKDKPYCKDIPREKLIPFIERMKEAVSNGIAH